MFPVNWATYLSNSISGIKANKLYRSVYDISEKRNGMMVLGERQLWDFGSNDYLGLSTDSERVKSICSRLIENKLGLGSSASRLLSGNCSYFEFVESKLAKFRNKEAALIFPSGYQANLSIISSLCDKETIIIADKLVHASIIDGIKLSSSRFFRYKHNDMNHLEDILKRLRKRYPQKRMILVTESLFSMEGDFAPLKDISRLCRSYGVLVYVDEAHSVGLWYDLDLSLVDVLVGTFGKSFGLWGAYVCGDSNLIKYLINKCRGFIFSTAPSPLLFLGVDYTLSLIVSNEFRSVLEQYRSNLSFFHKALQECGLIPKKCSISQIIPIIIGSPEKALYVSRKLFEKGFFIPAIRPPTVKVGSSRLRCSVTRFHNKALLKGLVDILQDLFFDDTQVLE